MAVVLRKIDHTTKARLLATVSVNRTVGGPSTSSYGLAECRCSQMGAAPTQLQVRESPETGHPDWAPSLGAATHQRASRLLVPKKGWPAPRRRLRCRLRTFTLKLAKLLSADVRQIQQEQNSRADLTTRPPDFALHCPGLRRPAFDPHYRRARQLLDPAGTGFSERILRFTLPAI